MNKLAPAAEVSTLPPKHSNYLLWPKDQHRLDVEVIQEGMESVFSYPVNLAV